VAQGLTSEGITLNRNVAATPSLSPPFSKNVVRASHSNAAIVGGILGAILTFAIVVRIILVVMRQRRQSSVKILQTEEDGRTDTLTSESHQLDNLRAVSEGPEKQTVRHLHNKGVAALPASFELQWSTVQPHRNEGSPPR
jgi:hypothetical protein